jgi:predicted ATPase
MKIERFTIPATDAHAIGMQEVHMERLGRIVAIAGKNGAGKSRLLDALEHAIGAHNGVRPNIEHHRRARADLSRMMQEHPQHELMSNWQRDVRTHDKQIATFDRIRTDSESVVRPIQFVPRGMNLFDPLADSPANTLAKYQAAAGSSIHEFQNLCLPYIQQTQSRWWNATHPQFSEGEEAKAQILDEYESLQLLLESFLGVRADRSRDGAATLFGRALADARLSAGQKVLTQLAVAVHAKRSALKDVVFLLDELENHLHPSVAIDILEKIRDVAPEAQVWLATHSIPLLAYVVGTEPASLWYVEGGAVSHAGRKPQLVLRSLLGDENRIGQLHALTSLPAQLASINYAAESLLPPAVVMASANDPQVTQVRRVLWSDEHKQTLSLLDFGAGKGRLLEGLDSLTGGGLASFFDYVAYDEYVGDAVQCKERIGAVFGSSAGRYFNDQDDLLGIRGNRCFDAAVMCNVLHEVPPSAWLQLFSGASLLSASLKDDGYLLIVEDLRIPTGEKAHEYGFLVLETLHLRTLFSVSQADIDSGLFKVDDARGDGRLKAHLVSKQLFERVSRETRSEAIAQLLATALRRIGEIRRLPHSYSNGMLHGFWTQQYANAALALRDLGQA